MRSRGMRAFSVIWLGQTVSLLGSAMSWFGFSLWAWDRTGSATAWALVQAFAFAPGILFSPLAGVLTDRFNRKAILLLSDGMIALGTLAVLALYSLGILQVWHLYVIGFVTGLSAASQRPAFQASITLLLPKEHYARAEGMQSASYALQGIVAPFLAAVLIRPVGLQGILAIDLVTYLAALGTLAWAAIPQPARRPAVEGDAPRAVRWWSELLYGTRHILGRQSLAALVLTFAAANIFWGLASALIAPMVLARSGNDAAALGSVESIGAVGGLAGGVLLSVWGGPKRRMHGVVWGWMLANMLGLALMGAGRQLAIWAVGSFCYAFFMPLLDGSYKAIWQAKVAPEVQGRVLASQQWLVNLPAVIGMALAGPVADGLFEPALAVGGPWAASVGRWLGTGPGAGMGFLMLVAGIAAALIGLAGYGWRRVRDLEDLLPDYDGAVPAAEQEQVLGAH